MNFRTLLHRLGDGQTPLSISSLYALSGISRAQLEAFCQELPHFLVERRRAILQGLAEITEASFEADFNAIFRLCLTDEDEEVRAQAIEGLWEDESVALMRSLLEILRSDPSPLVRAQAAAGLGRFVLKAELEEMDAALGAQVQEALLKVIYEPQESLEVRRRAVEAIGFSGEEVVREIIEAAYRDGERKMRVSALFAMGRSADSYWGEILLGELKNPDLEMRYEAARACGELELRKAVSTLVELVDDPDREVQGAAIWALGQIGGDKVRRILMACCQSGDEALAEVAEEALAELEFASGLLDISIYDEEDDL